MVERKLPQCVKNCQETGFLSPLSPSVPQLGLLLLPPPTPFTVCSPRSPHLFSFKGFRARVSYRGFPGLQRRFSQPCSMLSASRQQQSFWHSHRWKHRHTEINATHTHENIKVYQLLEKVLFRCKSFCQVAISRKVMFDMTVEMLHEPFGEENNHHHRIPCNYCMEIRTKSIYSLNCSHWLFLVFF